MIGRSRFTGQRRARLVSWLQGVAGVLTVFTLVASSQVVGFVEPASAQAPITTVLVPSNKAIVSGTKVALDASASYGTTQVRFVLNGGTQKRTVIRTAAPTIYGWIVVWNSTAVPNGTYTLHSVAVANGVRGKSTAISVTVDNAPPSTSVLTPSSGATLFGPTILDAAASDSVGVTKVEFQLTGGTLNDVLVATATPTLFGWIADWNTRTVPNGSYTLQSVAYDAEGLSTRSTGTTVSVLNGPIAYVAENGGDNETTNVTPINTEDNMLGRPITGVGDQPLFIAISPDGTTAYVSNFFAVPGTITPINLVTGLAESPITIGLNVAPGAIAITPDGSTAYVQDENTGAVVPVDLATKAIGTPIPTCTAPEDRPDDIVISPNGTTAYVSCSLASNVVPIDLSTNTAGSPIAISNGTFGLAITPNGATLYVANFGTFAVVNGVITQTSDGTTVTPIDTATKAAGTPITVGSEPSSVATTPDGKTAYVENAQSHTISPIDIATNTAGSPVPINATSAIPLNSQPGQIAITPDGTTAYVVSNNNTVVPIATATNTPESPIPAGQGLLGIAIR